MTIEKNDLPALLRRLRLGAMSELCERLHDEAIEKGWTPGRYLKVLCEHELSGREDRRLARYLAEAQLPKGKSMETFNFNLVPFLSKTQISGFASGDSWIKTGKNILLFGPSGSGKNHLAAAIGEGLVTSGYRVLFTSTIELIQKLQLAKKELELPAALDKLDKYDCLICTRWGYVEKDRDESSVLFELVSKRYENKSMLITCNRDFSEWDKIFIDKAMSVAVVDRLIHHAHIIELNVESYRKREALSRVKSPQLPDLKEHIEA